MKKLPVAQNSQCKIKKATDNVENTHPTTV